MCIHLKSVSPEFRIYRLSGGGTLLAGLAHTSEPQVAETALAPSCRCHCWPPITKTRAPADCRDAGEQLPGASRAAS